MKFCAFVRVNEDLPAHTLSLPIWFQFSKCFGTLGLPDEIKSCKCKLRAPRAWENSDGRREPGAAGTVLPESSDVELPGLVTAAMGWGPKAWSF